MPDTFKYSAKTNPRFAVPDPEKDIDFFEEAVQEFTVSMDVKVVGTGLDRDIDICCKAVEQMEKGNADPSTSVVNKELTNTTIQVDAENKLFDEEKWMAAKRKEMVKLGGWLDQQNLKIINCGNDGEILRPKTKKQLSDFEKSRCPPPATTTLNETGRRVGA